MPVVFLKNRRIPISGFEIPIPKRLKDSNFELNRGRIKNPTQHSSYAYNTLQKYLLCLALHRSGLPEKFSHCPFLQSAEKEC